MEIEGRLSRKFAHPEYARLGHAQFKGNTWGPSECREFNKSIRGEVESDLRELIYHETSHNIHRNTATCTCIELVEHMRGRDMSKTTKKWNGRHEARTKYYVRWMGEVATHRDHLSRTIRELEQK